MGYPSGSKKYFADYYQAHKNLWRERAKVRYAKNKTRLNELAVIRLRAIRKEMLTAYGGQCVCCGEREPVFLTIDHMNRDGAEHRRRVGPHGVYQDLRRKGWPKDGYQLLCWNCNCATKYGQKCPHKKESQNGTNH